jgi:hypothetical protein
VSRNPAAAVGIRLPSVIDFATGRVVSSVNVPLADVPLRQVLEERLGRPVFVDNDATVAALAEAHDEHLEMVVRNLVMITLGTGVGGGLVLGAGSTGGRRVARGSSAIRSSACPLRQACPRRATFHSHWSASPRDARSTGSPRTLRPPTRPRRSGNGEGRASPCLAPMWWRPPTRGRTGRARRHNLGE